MTHYKAVVFDMDGTILDTLTDMHNAVNRILTKHGCPERTFEQVKSYVGNGIKPLLERAFPKGYDGDFNKLTEEFMLDYKVHCADFTRPYDGIPEVMKALRNSGVKVAIVSNKPDLAVNKLAERFFDGLYDVAVGEIEGLDKKPAPDEVYHALNMLDVENTSAVYVGDSDVDLLTAKNSEMDCISVSWGFKTREFLEDLNAKTIIDSPAEILSIVFGK